jgi:hypothetical protein
MEHQCQLSGGDVEPVAELLEAAALAALAAFEAALDGGVVGLEEDLLEPGQEADIRGAHGDGAGEFAIAIGPGSRIGRPRSGSGLVEGVSHRTSRCAGPRSR